MALGLCSQIDLDAEVKKAAARLARERHEVEAVEPAKGRHPHTGRGNYCPGASPAPEAPMATALAQEARQAMAAPEEEEDVPDVDQSSPS